MLSQAQIETFDTEGVLVVENVLGPDILGPVRAEYARVLDGLYARWLANGLVPEATGFEARLLEANRSKCDWFQPMDISLPGDRIAPDTPMHFGPAVFDMVTAPVLLDLVEDMIGPEITSNPIQHVRIKPPVAQLHDGEARAHVGGTDWHQDRAVALEEADRTRMITVWIAITDATEKNGCLQCVPRVSEMLPHCPQRQTAIAQGYLDEDKARSLPVRAGGVVILHPLIPHASLPNMSDGIRWSFDLRFNVSGEPTGRAHFPEFVARSASAPDTVLRDWKKWRGVWEDARLRLAETQHIDIHRWRSDAPACA